jgi:choice-of-anchor B domain-containing protein
MSLPTPRIFGSALIAFAMLGAALPASRAEAQVSRNVELLSHIHSYARYSACWSYVHSNGDEYAAIGTDTGTAFYRLTDARNPALVGFIPGPPSQWREMKQYRNWFYIVSEGAGAGNGLQVVRMTNPNAPQLVYTYTATFNTAHTVTIDTTRALLYANGARNSSGMHVLSLANPESPVEVGAYTGPYVHDSHVRDLRLYTSHISEGWVRVLDVSDPSDINAPTSVLAEQSFSNPFPHNAWTSPDHKFLYVTNENTEGLMKTFDIGDLESFVQTASYRARPGSICHNVHSRGDTLFASHYTEGVRLLDITDPARPVEWGYYDTWPGASGGFNGNWEVAPDFPSGIFILSDMSTGLYVLRATPAYGIVAGKVMDQTGALVAGADVTLTSGNAGGSLTAGTLVSGADGRFRAALDAGAYSYEAEKFGYDPGSAAGTMAAGATDSITIVVQRQPFAGVFGTVTAGAASAFALVGDPLPGAELHVDDTPFDTVAVASGGYRMSLIPQGVWSLHVTHPAFVPEHRWIGIAGGVNEEQDFALLPVSFYDLAEVPGGWSLTAVGDNAAAGRWAHGDPNGTGSAASGQSTAGQSPAGQPLSDPGPIVNHPDHGSEDGAGPGPVAPENDHSPPPGINCFVTGLGLPGQTIGDHDVDAGRTTLTSPNCDLSAIADPVIAYYRWYVNDGNSAVDDALVVQLSNNGGASWVHVDSLAVSRPFWQRKEVRVSDFVVPTATVRIRFIASDVGSASVVEAGVDDVSFYGRPSLVGVPPGSDRPPARLSLLGVRPNPASGPVEVRLSASPGSLVEATIYDIRGRFVKALPPQSAVPSGVTLRWDGRDDAGRPAAAGVYLVRVSAGAERVTARLVRMAAE